MENLAPAKSHTDPPAPEHHRADRPLVPRRLHAGSFRSKGQYGPGNQSHHSYRQHAKDTVQSAIELKPPITFEHFLDKKSPNSSRRGSSTAQQQQVDGGSSVHQQEMSQKVVRTEDVAQAKKDNERREEQLRASLKSVEELSMSSTRQLDDTYYAILEKASILRSTVASLQHLADESRRMHTTFDEDARKLDKDTRKNVDSFGNFQQQEKTINQLVTKLQESKSQTTKLNDRLESARLRVESYEKRENEKLAKRRVRWHMLWGTSVGVLLLLIAILLARNRRKVGRQLDTVGEQLVKLADIAEDVVSPLSAKLRSSPSKDPYLQKLFDDL